MILAATVALSAVFSGAFAAPAVRRNEPTQEPAAAAAPHHPTLPTVPENTAWVGHSSTDVDSYCGAMAAADLFGGVHAIAAGPTTLDVKFVQNYFGFEPAVLSNDASLANFSWGLVDHHINSQNPEGVDPENIVAVIDHRPFDGDMVRTEGSRFVLNMAYGSVNTALYYLYQWYGKEVTQPIADCLLAAIIADTNNLSGKSTTDDDHAAVAALVELSSVTDIEAFTEDMINAKSDYANAAAAEIIMMDSKDYVIADMPVIYAVAETNDPKPLLEWKEEIVDAIVERKAREQPDIMLFSVTDIVGKVSYQFCVTDDECNLLEEVYPEGTWYEENMILEVPGVTGRKSAMIPRLTAVLEARAAAATETDTESATPTPTAA